MSDHVGTLLSIELGSAPVLAPRPVSLFEPVQPAPVEASNNVQDVEFPASAQVRPQRRGVLSARDGVVDPDDLSERVIDASRAVPMENPPVEIQAGPPQPHRTPSTPMRHRLEPRGVLEDIDEADGPLLVPAPRAPNGRLRSRGEEQQSERRAVPHSIRVVTAGRRSTTASASLETRAPQPSISVPPHASPVALPPDRSPGRNVRTATHASAERMFPTDDRLAPSAPAEPSPPTVVVTIGRVEVRATSKEPPAQVRRSSRNDGLSLEAYLRSGPRGDR